MATLLWRWTSTRRTCFDPSTFESNRNSERRGRRLIREDGQSYSSGDGRPILCGRCTSGPVRGWSAVPRRSYGGRWYGGSREITSEAMGGKNRNSMDPVYQPYWCSGSQRPCGLDEHFDPHRKGIHNDVHAFRLATSKLEMVGVPTWRRESIASANANVDQRW